MTTVLPAGGGDLPERPERPKLIDATARKKVSIEVPDHNPIVLELSENTANHFDNLNSLRNEPDIPAKTKELLDQIKQIYKQDSNATDTTIFDLLTKEENLSQEGLYFPILENLTSVLQRLDTTDQNLLVHQIHEHNFGSWGCDTDEQSFIAAGFFLILKTTLIEEDVKKRYSDDEERKTHLKVIDQLRSQIIYYLDYSFNIGELSKQPLDAFKDDFDILTLAKSTHLKYFFKLASAWNDEVQKGSEVFEQNFLPAENVDSLSFERDTITARRNIERRAELERAIDPNDSGIKQKAFEEPFSHLTDLARTKDITCIELCTYRDLEYISDYLKEIGTTQLSAIDALKDADYKNFAIEISPFLYPIIIFLNRAENPKSMKALTQTLQECFSEKTLPDFRREFDLPSFNDTPEEVDAMIEFLDNLWDKTKGTNIFFYTVSEFDRDNPLNDWEGIDLNEKIGIFSTDATLAYNFNPEDMCFMHHYVGFKGMDNENFELKNEIADIAHEHTIDSVCAIPVKDNSSLLTFIENNEDLIFVDYSPYYATLTESEELPNIFTQQNSPIDAYLITLIRDDGNDSFQMHETPAPFVMA